MSTAHRDHLFISYAWEDAPLADWLVRRLTALGYRVWCDRFKLLGGERWPKDIDKAIKTRTFRMIALLSKFSLHKENPSKERQIALALSKERQENFLIPLNVDGLRATEIGWELSDVNWVPFANWADGLKQLSELLRHIGAPCRPPDEGTRAAIETYLPGKFMLDTPEPLWSNCYEITEIPATFYDVQASRKLASVERYQLSEHWPFYRIADDRFIAFSDPPAIAEMPFSLARTDTHPRTTPLVAGVSGIDIATHLVKRGLFHHARSRGLAMTRDWTAYFPSGLLPKDKLSFVSYTGKKSSIAVLGERKFGNGRMRYNLGATFFVKLDLLPMPVVQIKARLNVTDPAKPNLSGHGINARRKAVAKNWWNHEWLTRQLAIVQFLAEGHHAIVVGDIPDERLVVRSSPLGGTVTPRIDDAELGKLREQIKAMNTSLTSLSDEGDDMPQADNE